MNVLNVSRNVFEALSTSPTLCSTTALGLIVYSTLRWWNQKKSSKQEFSPAASLASLASIPLNLLIHPTLLPAVCVAYLTIWNAYFYSNRIVDPANVCMSTSIPISKIASEPFRLFAHPYFVSPKIASWPTAMAQSFALAVVTHFLQKSLGFAMASIVAFLAAPGSFLIARLAAPNSCIHGPTKWLALLVGISFILNHKIAFPAYLRKEIAVTPLKKLKSAANSVLHLDDGSQEKSKNQAAEENTEVLEEDAEGKEQDILHNIVNNVAESNKHAHSPVPLASKLISTNASTVSDVSRVADEPSEHVGSLFEDTITPFVEKMGYGNPLIMTAREIGSGKNSPLRGRKKKPAGSNKADTNAFWSGPEYDPERLLVKEKDVAEALMDTASEKDSYAEDLDSQYSSTAGYVKPRAAESRWLPLALFLLSIPNSTLNSKAWMGDVACFVAGCILSASTLRSEEKMMNFFKGLLINKKNTLLAFASGVLIMLGIYVLPFTLGRPTLSAANHLLSQDWWKAVTLGRGNPLASLVVHHSTDWLCQLSLRLTPLAILGAISQRRFPTRLGSLILFIMSFAALTSMEMPLTWIPGPGMACLFGGIALSLITAK